MPAILGKKLGMTRVFDEDGTQIPVTVVEAAPNTVTAIRKADRDGYDAVQLAGIPTEERKLTKAQLGHLKKANAQSAQKKLVEFRDVEFPTRRPGGGRGRRGQRAEVPARVPKVGDSSTSPPSRLGTR